MAALLEETQYAEQLTRITRALAIAQNNSISRDLGVGQSLERVALFTDGNLDKRFEKLVDQVEIVSELFDDLESFIEQYIQTVPLAAYDSGSSDGNRFAEWLSRKVHLTAEQGDALTIVRARYAVEEHARANRIGHLHFQEVSSLIAELAPELPRNPKLQLRLNPIRQWAVLETTRFLDGDDIVPADVLFYACGREVRTVVLNSLGRSLIRALSKFGPCPLRQVEKQLFETDRGTIRRSAILDLVNDCLQIGLIAIG